MQDKSTTKRRGAKTNQDAAVKQPAVHQDMLCVEDYIAVLEAVDEQNLASIGCFLRDQVVEVMGSGCFSMRAAKLSKEAERTESIRRACNTRDEEHKGEHVLLYYCVQINLR